MIATLITLAVIATLALATTAIQYVRFTERIESREEYIDHLERDLQHTRARVVSLTLGDNVVPIRRGGGL